MTDLDKSKKEDTKEPKTAMGIMEEVKQKIMVVQCENCGKLHVYKRRKKDGEACSYCGGGPMWMMGNAIMHENKENQVKIRVSVEREELDRLMKDMDNVNKLANETYDKIRKLSKIKIEC